jgi:hypothetical protein
MKGGDGGECVVEGVHRAGDGQHRGDEGEVNAYTEHRSADGGAGVVAEAQRREKGGDGLEGEKSPLAAAPRGSTRRATTADIGAGTSMWRRGVQVRASEACATFGQRSALVH